MHDPPAAAVAKNPAANAPKPCSVCDAPGGKHCTKCKSRHYCSKACQLVDWNERGHKAQCKEMAAEFQDRHDELMPAKKVKEEPAIVEDVAPAASSKAARLPAVGSTALVKATALNDDSTDWRGTCAVCLDLLPVEPARQIFYSCCCKKLGMECSNKCEEYDKRCPLCRAQFYHSDAEWVSWVQKHVDKGDAEGQFALAAMFKNGDVGLKQSHKRAFRLYQLAAAQGLPFAQTELGLCYEHGRGVKIDFKAAALWYRRAAERGDPEAQYNLGYRGKGVAQSYGEAVEWHRLAAAQGYAYALYKLGVCHANGQSVLLDLHEALRFKRAAAKGNAKSPEAVKSVEALIAASR